MSEITKAEQKLKDGFHVTDEEISRLTQKRGETLSPKERETGLHLLVCSFCSGKVKY